MPNFKTTGSLQSDICRMTNTLVERRAVAIEQGFPVKQEQLQDLVTPPALRTPLAALRAAGADGVSRARSVYGALAAELPGLEQACLIEMTPVEPVWCLFTNQEYSYRSKRDFDAGLFQTLPFDWKILEPDGQAALTAWCNQAVRARRVAASVNRLVTNFVDNHAPTGAHLAMRWPDLKIVLGRLPEPWPTRARALPTTRLKAAWRWPAGGPAAEWRHANQDRMNAASLVLREAAMLPEQKAAAEGAVTARVITWEKNK